jgi:cytidylate kinase
MPETMLVVIDGWADTKKTLVGEWVAEAMGGLLVDSDQIYHALVVACSKAGVDVNRYASVESWCERAGVDIGFAKKRKVAGYGLMTRLLKVPSSFADMAAA